eukprot:TRINITY_DN12858_c0_g1_i7.p1 TRINITY_DN12858_c0_g1~~TRINITY_DN12858_c0_g1_i7.p1  ORF type:complete len:552 (+),score=154.97 TRINITY_DN12858_c0_g1_i7:1591-3246(+)
MTSTTTATELSIEASAANIAVNSVVLSLIGVYFLVSCWEYWIRCDQEPIRARKPKLVLFSLTSFWIYGIMKCTVHAFKNPLLKCGMTTIVEKLLEAISFCLLTLRIGLLYLDFVAAKDSEKMVMNTRATNAADHPGAMQVPMHLKIRKFMKDRTRRLVALSGMSVIVIGGVFAVYGWKMLPLAGVDYLDPSCAAAQTYVREVELPFELTVVGVIALAAFKLWKVKENFGIFKEVCVVIGFLLLRDLFLVIDFTGGVEAASAQAARLQFYQLLEIMVPFVGITAISLNYQTWLVEKWNNVLKEAVPGAQFDENDPQELAEFMDIICSTKGYFTFSNFAMLDLASERLLFWRDVEKFRKKELSAREIFDTYLSSDAPLHVKLSSRVFAKITEFFERMDDKYLARASAVDESISVKLIDPHDPEADGHVLSIVHVFDDAQNEIFLNLFHTSFGRFKMTDDYKKIKEHMDNSGSQGTAEKVKKLLEKRREVTNQSRARKSLFRSFHDEFRHSTPKKLMDRDNSKTGLLPVPGLDQTSNSINLETISGSRSTRGSK